MDTPLEKAKRDLKMYRSILEMLKGNTTDEAIKALEMRWVEPLLGRIRDFESRQH